MTNPFDEINAKLEAIRRSMNNPEPPPEWLDVDQAADFLNLKKSTVYKKVMLGELPYYKTGKKLKFKRSELEAYIEAGRQNTNVFKGIRIEK